MSRQMARVALVGAAVAAGERRKVENQAKALAERLDVAAGLPVARVGDDGMLYMRRPTGKEVCVGRVAGPEGQPGGKGEPGENGTNGVGIERIRDFKRHFTISLTNGERICINKLAGEDGDDGDDGIGIERVADGPDHFAIHLTDGRKFSIAKSKSRDGVTGVGIDAVSFANYKLQITLTDGTTYTSPSLRGPRGPRGKPGLMGPMPRHQWHGTAVRFEMAPGVWGAYRNLVGQPGGGGSQQGGAGVQSIAINPDNTITITDTTGNEIDSEGAFTVPYDDYAQTEWLDEQTSAGGVLNFNFSAPVQFIVIEMIADGTDEQIEAAEGRVADGATDPTATKGAILKHEQPVTLLVNADTVNVLAPNGARVNVYGKRRVAI